MTRGPDGGRRPPFSSDGARGPDGGSNPHERTQTMTQTQILPMYDHDRGVRRSLIPILFGTLIPAAFMAWFLILDRFTDRTFLSITEDLWHWAPDHGTHQPLDGFGTTLAVTGWALAVGVSGLAWAVTRRPMFAAFGGFSLMLLLDDALGIHEWWLYEWGFRTRSEVLLLAAQVVLLAWILRWAWPHVTHRPVLAAAGVAFALGLCADHPVFIDKHTHWLSYFDDGGKLIGIGLWVAWLTAFAVDRLRQDLS